MKINIDFLIENMKKYFETNTDIFNYFLSNNCLLLAEHFAHSQAESKKVDALKTINKLLSKRRYESCRQLFENLNEDSVTFAIVKGDILSKQIYGCIGYRRSSDIDILVGHQDIEKIKNILRKNGFFQLSTGDKECRNRKQEVFWAYCTHQVFPFVKIEDNLRIIIDLNFDIYWSEKKNEFKTREVLQRNVISNIYSIQVPIVDHEMAFVLMCLHHYKDTHSVFLISQGGYKLSIFVDIFAFILCNNINYSKLIDYINLLNAKQYVLWCIFSTEKLFPHQKLKYLLALINDNDSEIIDTYGLGGEEYYWYYDLYDRLFKIEFLRDFTNSLSPEQKEIIRKNLLYM